MRRDESREPLGVNEENAHFVYLFGAINPGKPEDKDYFIRKGLDLAKGYGYTTVVEGQLMAAQQPDLVSAAERGLFDIDVLSYVDFTAREILATPWFSKSYKGRYRLAGEKITLDGSPQGRTAWRTMPYLLPPDRQKPGYKGYPAIPDTKEVASLVDEAYQKGWPLQVHVNGDAAVDQLPEAVRPAQQKYGPGDRRLALIHGQFLRKDQIPWTFRNPRRLTPAPSPARASAWPVGGCAGEDGAGPAAWRARLN